MARNEEKAQSMLYRFRANQAAQLSQDKPRERQRRPTDVSTVENIGECERYQRDLQRLISRLIGKLHGDDLSDESRIRDINDGVNKHLKEWYKWQRRIVELGGKPSKNELEKRGKEIPGKRGYRYFGSALDLKGVREYFVQGSGKSEQIGGRSLEEIWKDIDVDYYGYRDEEDGELLEYEANAENELLEHTTRKMTDNDEVELEDADTLDIAIPTQEEIRQYLDQKQKYLVEKEKQRLLNKYVSKDLQMA